MRISHRAGPWITGLLLAGSTLALNYIFPNPVLNAFNGDAFTPLSTYVRGPSSDRGFASCFFLFAYILAATTAILLSVRWISNRKNRTTYWVFAIFSFILFLLPLCILTINSYHLVMYIKELGFTPMRIIGLVVATGGYFFIFALLFWAIDILSDRQKY